MPNPLCNYCSQSIRTFSQILRQHVGPDMSDAEHLSETSCGDKHLSARDFQCLDHMDVITLGNHVRAHLTTAARKVVVALVVEELYGYGFLHVTVTF
jgi:hypothetical protein